MKSKKYTKLGIIILVLILVVIVASLSVFLIDSGVRKGIEDTKDLRLVNFVLAKDTARESMNLLVMTQSSYESNAVKFKNRLKPEMYNSFFSSPEDYPKVASSKIAIRGIKGEIISGYDFVFKIDSILVTGLEERNLETLVYVKNNVIYRIESLR